MSRVVNLVGVALSFAVVDSLVYVGQPRKVCFLAGLGAGVVSTFLAGTLLSGGSRRSGAIRVFALLNTCVSFGGLVLYEVAVSRSTPSIKRGFLSPSWFGLPAEIVIYAVASLMLIVAIFFGSLALLVAGSHTSIGRSASETSKTPSR